MISVAHGQLLVDPSRAEEELGPNVVNGVLQWLSATIIALGDPTQYGGCERFWWYKYVDNRRPAGEKYQSTGKDMHGELERWYKFESNVLGPLAFAGVEFMPERGPHALPEHAIGPEISRDARGLWVGPQQQLASGGPAPMLTAGGVWVFGHSDLMNTSGIAINDRGERMKDPARTVEVNDWKSTKSLEKYMKKGYELAELVQMLTYGEYARRRWQAEWVRLSQVFFQTVGRKQAEKATVLVRGDDLAKRWNRVDGVARRLTVVAGCSSAEQVPGNPAACRAFKGCPHVQYCSVGQRQSLESVFGGNAAMDLLSAMQQGAAAPVAVTPTAVSHELSLIAAEQQRAMAAVQSAVPQQAMPQQLDPFTRAVQVIRSAPYGQPQLHGAAAAAWYSIHNSPNDGVPIGGTGALANTVIDDPAKLIALAMEIESMLRAGAAPQPAPPVAPPPVAPYVPPSPFAPQNAGILPPDAPASNPALAAKPVEGFGASVSFSPPAAPQQHNPLAAMVAQATVAPVGAPTQPALAQPAAAPAKRKRRTKAEIAAANAAGPTVNPVAVQNTVNVAPAAPRPTQLPGDVFDGAFILLVDQQNISVPHERFEPIVDEWCRLLCQRYGADDIRCAPQDGPLGYGRWPGALAALAREAAAKDLIPAGVYALDARDAIGECVANALRGSCDLYVRGGR